MTTRPDALVSSVAATPALAVTGSHEANADCGVRTDPSDRLPNRCDHPIRREWARVRSYQADSRGF